MAVAIWDHEPDADELLARRLEAGWQPTPTPTVEGDVVLGFAAKAGSRCILRQGAQAVSLRQFDDMNVIS
jgi:hypothetical protein